MSHFARLSLPSFLVLIVLSLAGCGGLGNSGSIGTQPANVSITASAGSITEGQPVTLEAYVNPVLASGTVTLYNGSSVIGTASLGTTPFSTTGIALLATSFSSVGPQSITVHYNGNNFYAPGTSLPITIGVYNAQLASTSLTLQASTTTPQYLTGVTLTATVAPASASGTVTFYNGSTNIGSGAVSNGVATLTTSFAAGGAATLHAVYSGDYNFLSSTSNSLAMNVTGPLVTTTTLSASPTATAIGNSVILTAQLSPATATGTVTFYNGTTAIGTSNVSAGIATLNTTFTAPGNASLKAVFAANAAWETSTSNQLTLFVSGNTPTTVQLQASPTSLVIGYASTVTATVSSSTATGTMVLYDGTRAIDVTTFAGGIAQFNETFMSAGAHSLTAVYSGNTTYLSSTSSPVIVNVSNPGSTPTTTTLTLSEYNGSIGDYVTLSVSVKPSSATGRVDFYDNGSFLQSVVLSSGVAAWSQSFPNSGDNSITAYYNGDTTYAPSGSTAQDLELSDPTPPTPSCPTDPILCPVFCPGNPLCP